MLDASVLLAAEDSDDVNHDASSQLLASGLPLATIDLAAYETVNVAVARWNDLEAAARLQERFFAIADDGHIVRVTETLIVDSTEIASSAHISVYGAAYVAAARSVEATLSSCDVKDLVSRDLALLPRDLLTDPA